VFSATDQGYYPMLSGNKYRYAIRFTLFTPTVHGSTAVEAVVSFRLACC
jgi:cell division protein ZapD